MSDSFAAVGCSIEAYPFEGGPYYIQGGQIKAVSVTKSLQGVSNGRFSITLAPGGPAGPESVPVWSQILTPGSHVLIGMNRGTDAAIVMDGVVTTAEEDQAWQINETGALAMRTPVVTGSDFNWFFTTQNWYSLAMYGLVAGTGLGGQFGYLPSSLVPLMSQGLIGNGSPVQVGQKWYEVMAGASGMLANTFVAYQGGRLPFSGVVSQVMEQYPNVYIPLTEQFLGLESWASKFVDIFPWPWYEFFVTTAPSGTYSVAPAASGSPANVAASGRAFTMRDFPTAPPAGPVMVARVNPVPRFDFIKISSIQQYIADSVMDVSRWNALPLTDFTQAPYGFHESRVGFTSDEARNFYMLNPTAYQTLFGSNGSNVVPFPFVFMAAADPASVHRYGYKPAAATLRWFYDWEGLAARNKELDIQQSVATLTGALASWWHPLPLMLRGQIIIPLSPNVYIGTRFRYAPYKDGVPWDFYVEEVTHNFVFGGHSTTQLTLTRGLPKVVYEDTAQDGLLRAIYTGNARRESGQYKVGLPDGTGQGLQAFSTPQNAADLAQQMSQMYATPQYSGG